MLVSIRTHHGQRIESPRNRVRQTFNDTSSVPGEPLHLVGGREIWSLPACGETRAKNNGMEI